jgi:hypothetical protein
LGAAAVELARGHGVIPTAQALHLEYGKLKGMMESASPMVKSRTAKVRAKTFQFSLAGFFSI